MSLLHYKHNKMRRAGDWHNQYRDPLRVKSIKYSLPAVYSKYLSEALSARIEELAHQSQTAQQDLSEELALVRLTALDAAKLYDQARVIAEAVPDNKDAQEVKLAAGQQLRSVLAEVADMVQRIVAIQNAGRDKIGVQGIALLVAQVVQMAYDVFGEDNIPLVQEFAARIRDLRLPTDSPSGTDLRPDDDVIEMDATVPKLPEPAEA